MIKRIAAIGRDPALVAEVAAQARREYAARRKSLDNERQQIGRALREQARAVAQVVGQENASGHLANLHDQIRAGENRVAEIGVELARLGDGISAKGVAEALGRFHDLVAAMPPGERARLVGLLVERVAFDRKNGTVSISFTPTGFEAILGEQGP